MKRFLQLLVLVALAMYNAIQTVTGGATIKKLVPTGVITNGILGGFSGKVGPVVGGKWKDVDYMRSYVIPANPNTTGQQTVRARFSALVAYAKAVLPTLLQTYWDPFYSGMSGFNAFIKENYSELAVNDVIDTSCVMSKGSLEKAAAFTVAQISGTNLTLTWNGAISGNGLGTDTAHLVVWKSVNNSLKLFTTSLTRTDNGGVVVVDSGTTEDDIAFLFFSRGTGASFVVSDSQSLLITTP